MIKILKKEYLLKKLSDIKAGWKKLVTSVRSLPSTIPKKWKDMKRIYKELIVAIAIIISVLIIADIFLRITGQPDLVKILTIFWKSNPVFALAVWLFLISLLVFLINWRWGDPLTWFWKKTGYIVGSVSTFILIMHILFSRVSISEVQAYQIEFAFQKKMDSTIAANNRQNAYALKDAKAPVEGLKNQNTRLKQSFDSLLAVSNAKDQKSRSLEGVIASLKNANHLLDSVNAIPKETVFIPKEVFVKAPVPAVSPAKVTPPAVVKTDDKKSASNAGKKGPKKPNRQHIVWEQPKQKVKYKSPPAKICFN